MTVATFHYRTGRTETRHVDSRMPVQREMAMGRMPALSDLSRPPRVRERVFKARRMRSQYGIEERYYVRERGHALGLVQRQAIETDGVPEYAEWIVKRIYPYDMIAIATWLEYFEQDPSRYDLRWYWICIRDDFREHMTMRRERFRKAFFVRREMGAPWADALDMADNGNADRLIEARREMYGYGRMDEPPPEDRVALD